MTRSELGSLRVDLRKFIKKLMALDFCQNFVSTPYLKIELLKFTKLCILFEIDKI